MVTSLEIREHIKGKFEQYLQLGARYCTLVSGDIAREMGLKDRMPMVCEAMYHLMGEESNILYSPPKRKGATLRIEYRLR